MPLVRLEAAMPNCAWLVFAQRFFGTGTARAAERFIPSPNGSQSASAQCRTALTRAAVGAIVKSARINTIVYGFHVESA